MKENDKENRDEKDNKELAEDLRVEYSALSNYYSTLIGFRLTLLGFYLAAVALLLSNTWPFPFPTVVLALLLTSSLYLFELRTRTLFHHLAKRGIEIEQVNWNYKQHDVRPFFSRQFPLYLKRHGIIERDYSTRLKILGLIPVNVSVTHSLALDLMYIGLFIFLLISLLFIV